MYLTLISAKAMTSQPPWSVWCSYSDLEPQGNVGNQVIWSLVFQNISLGVTDPVIQAARGFIFQASSKHASPSTKVKILGQAEFSVQPPLLPAHCDQLLSASSIKLVIRSLGAWGGVHQARDTDRWGAQAYPKTILEEIGHFTSRLCYTPTAYIQYVQAWILT